MKFTIIHPTARVTSELAQVWWRAMFSAWDGCEHPQEVEYIVVVHHGRSKAFWDGVGAIMVPQWGRFTVVTNYGRDCLVDQCNAGQLAMTGEILVGNQDDMRYPEHWDTEIRRLVPDTSKALCVQARTDTRRKDLLTIPTIATRVLIEQIGLIPPEYDGMFSDDEWSIKAHKFAGVIPSNLYFEHLHPTVGKSDQDEVYAMENRKEAYELGWQVFQERKALGFPRVPYPNENPATIPVQAPADYPVLAMCIPGDNFSGVWLDSFLAMGMELKEAGYIVKRFRGYHSIVYQTRIMLAKRVMEDAKISGDRPKYVLWLDHDNIVAPGQLTGLLKFLDHYEHVSAVAGWCWIKKPHGWTTSVGDFWPEDGVHLMQFNLDALLAGETPAERFAPKEIKHTGFPFLLMRYGAMEKLGQYAFRPLTKADLPAYFDGDMPAKEVADHWFSGEDSAWCLQAKKAGMTIMVDPGCKVGHVKLQLLEPLTTTITPETPVAEMERSIGINGPPVHAPTDYERSLA